MTKVTTNKTIKIEQLNACQRCLDVVTGETYYEVESATSDAIYEVRARKFDNRYFLVCNCKAGARGVTCWHKRASAQASQLYKAEQKALQAAREKGERVIRLMEMGLTEVEATLALKEQACQDDETLVRVYGPKHARPTEAEINRDAKRFAGRGFSLLK